MANKPRNVFERVFDDLRTGVVQWIIQQVASPITLLLATALAGASAWFHDFEWWAAILVAAIVFFCVSAGLNNWDHLVNSRSAEHKLVLTKPIFNNVNDPAKPGQVVKIGAELQNHANFPIRLKVTRIVSSIGRSSLSHGERVAADKRLDKLFILDSGQGMICWDGNLTVTESLNNVDIVGALEIEISYQRLNGPMHNLKRKYMLVWSTRENVVPFEWYHDD